MPRNTPVSQVMTTEVLTFHPEDNIADAMATMVDRGIDGAPVLGADRNVIGMLTTGDLIVQETNVHLPTVISLFGASIELPSSRKHFEEDLRKSLGLTVREVMEEDVVTVAPDATIEDAAFLMYDHHVSRLPVVGEDGLVGIVARVDILREMIRDDEAEADGAPGAAGDA
ncbi:MAG: CBS domain-containing protein [Acidimicrobiales bacterium]